MAIEESFRVKRGNENWIPWGLLVSITLTFLLVLNRKWKWARVALRFALALLIRRQESRMEAKLAALLIKKPRPF